MKIIFMYLFKLYFKSLNSCEEVSKYIYGNNLFSFLGQLTFASLTGFAYISTFCGVGNKNFIERLLTTFAPLYQASIHTPNYLAVLHQLCSNAP